MAAMIIGKIWSIFQNMHADKYIDLIDFDSPKCNYNFRYIRLFMLLRNASSIFIVSMFQSEFLFQM